MQYTQQDSLAFKQRNTSEEVEKKPLIVFFKTKEMVSHNECLSAAIKIIFYAILWIALGGILIFAGISITGISLSPINILSGNIQFRNPSLLLTIIGLFIIPLGYLIAFVGPLAAFLKGLTDLITNNFIE